MTGREKLMSDEENWYRRSDISSTFLKGLKVLSAFDDATPRLTLAEIGKLTELDRAAVRRLVITLVDFGYVEKTGKTFSLTPKILTLSGSYMRGNGVGVVVQPILNRYSEEMSAEISLAGVAETEAVYIAKSILAGSNISFGFTVGSRLSLLQTAIGRMLLASRDDSFVSDRVKNGSLRAYTHDSIMDRPLIRREIETARRQGFAIVTNEFEAGITGLAVPVGSPMTAKTVIGISAPVAVLRGNENRAHYLSVLQQCANELDRTQFES
ncbi:IclR family transcriptional regulator [Antarcticimicrobium sediminis]|uniref:IclR family transcriptional regulator n=2 Tax=Antarcticimicrobium sediminis TaxID=2546227 RepID=A0A4V2Z837_9RHOB|nr:IclR family transcriptional regulator [Antarcticimicrobium sediminis]